MHLSNLVIVTTALSLLLPTAQARAESFSASLLGPIGLNIIPTARMDEGGTARIGLSTLDPYQHAFIGFQLADPVYVQLRQSGEVSSVGFTQEPDRLYPGIDLKFRLTEEGRYQPEMAIGFNSAFGHKRHASEYIALSKRFWDVDFTSGIAWGRMAGSGHIRNPFRRASKHFKNERNFNAESPNTPQDWFTGKQIGFFAGVEYFTPLDGMSIKADWNADHFIPERHSSDYKSGGPWSVSVNYTPPGIDWASISAGTVGGEKIFARLSLQNNVGKWPLSHGWAPPAIPVSAQRPADSAPDRMQESAGDGGVNLYDLQIDQTRSKTNLDVSPYLPPALQIGRAVRHVANHAGRSVASLEITPRSRGLKGHTMRIVRRDVESATAQNSGSPEEIWADADFFYDEDKDITIRQGIRLHAPRLIWDNQLSLSEEDAGYVYRTSLIGDVSADLPYGFTVGGALRLNMADNLESLSAYRTVNTSPVRSDIDNYASRLFSLDRAYLSWMGTLREDLHIAVTAGALEEMYSGFGGEILYRPFGKTFAFGFEGWHVYKRDPEKAFTTHMHKIDYNTAFLNAWYEVPGTDLTLYAKAGRFLGEDDGVSGGLEMNFNNGAKLAGFVTATDRDEPDIFGGETHLYGGLRLTLPIGSFRYVPNGSEIRLRAAPLGRDSAQELDKPLPLYEVTEPMSYRRIARSWQEVLN